MMTILFKKINYLQLVLDLIIVFIGVSLAFLFTNYQEQKKKDKDTEQLISFLKIGLQRYDVAFNGFYSYHETYNRNFRNNLDNKIVPNINIVTFPAPAYPLDAFALLTKQGYRILNPEIYISLIAYTNAMERLEYIEQKLVNTSEKFTELNNHNISPEAFYFEQNKWARLYLRYLEIRKDIIKELLDKSDELKILLQEKYPVSSIEGK